MKGRALRRDEHITNFVARRTKTKRVSDVFALPSGPWAIFIIEKRVELARGALARDNFMLLFHRYVGVPPSSESIVGEKPPSENVNLHTG